MCEPSNTITVDDPSSARSVLDAVGNHACMVIIQFGGILHETPFPLGRRETLRTR